MKTPNRNNWYIWLVIAILIGSIYPMTRSLVFIVLPLGSGPDDLFGAALVAFVALAAYHTISRRKIVN